tara:strand:- start:19009 stop:19257 length:249 start_codon:yes stop_codon:yes gene_type:complete
MNTKIKNFTSSSSSKTESTFVFTELEFGLMDKRIQSVVLLATGKANSPWAIGIRHTQREAICANENWKKDFYDHEFPSVQLI